MVDSQVSCARNLGPRSGLACMGVLGHSKHRPHAPGSHGLIPCHSEARLLSLASCLPPSSDSSHGSSLMSHWMGAGLSHTVSLPQAHPAWSQGSLSDFQGLSLTLCKVGTQFTLPLPRAQKEGPWRSDLEGQCQGTWEKLDRGLLSARGLLRKQEWGRSGSYRNI